MANNREGENYNIVKYSVSSVKRDPEKEDSISVNLSTYFSIPYAHSSGYQLSGGATTIIYDSLGTNPKYVKTPYDLIGLNNERSSTSWTISRLDLIDDEGYGEYTTSAGFLFLPPNIAQIAKVSVVDDTDKTKSWGEWECTNFNYTEGETNNMGWYPCTATFKSINKIVDTKPDTLYITVWWYDWSLAHYLKVSSGEFSEATNE
jgi:hypothetical protein